MLQHRGGPAGELEEILQRQALEAAVAAEQAQADPLQDPGQRQHLHHPGAAQAVGQEALKVARLLCGELPAEQGHPAIGAEGQHRRLCRGGQDQPGWCRVIAQGHRLVEVEPAQRLGLHDLHDPISLDQQPALAG